MESRKVRSRKRRQSEYFFDYSLLFIVLFLLGFGMVMLYSTSSYKAVQDYGDSAYWLKKQVFAVIVGLILMAVAANFPYHWLSKIAWVLYFFANLLVLLIIPFGHKSHGAKRWLRIGKLSLQPAEVAKLCMIIFLAYFICVLGRNVYKLKAFSMVILFSAPIVVMIWKITSNLSSAIIILGICLLMLFVASPDYKKFIIMGLAALLIGAVTVFVITHSAGGVESVDYRGGRVLTWVDPEAYASNLGFQTLQGLYAIGSGGIWGKGLGQSMQKLGFLPEASNDMIFSIICEELGLFGAIAIILMFILLIWRLMVIAINAPDLFGALLVVGVLGHIAIQVILNIAVVTNTIPNTGISLPFISYGGTSVVFLLIEIGICLNVAKAIRLKEA